MVDQQKAQRLFVGFRHYAYGGEPQEFRALLAEVQPDAETLAAALLHASTMFFDGVRWPAVRPALEAHLQLLLTQEHVAAQERMSKAADTLQHAALQVSRASWGIAFATFAVTLAALYIAVVK